MLGIHDYWLFVCAGVLLNLMPGQDTMFIIGRSLSGGHRSGVGAALGISVGSLVHTLAAALGLSAILATSPVAFTVVRLAGALYLIYLGGRLLLSRATSPAPQPGGSTRSSFLQGIVTNVLNPKVALFFLAFLPQFIDAGSPTKTWAFLLLGATFVSTGTLWCLTLALAAARLQGALLGNVPLRTLIDRAVGGLFVVLGLRLAWLR
jgi:threonine/homoserine/homoserine lactone efflux protein